MVAGRYHLRIKVFGRLGECPAPQCRAISDDLGDHGISCGIGGECIARHNHVRDALFQQGIRNFYLIR